MHKISVVLFIVFAAHSFSSEIDTSKKVKVFILAGQSNMEGKAKLSLLNYQINAPETRDFFAHLHKEGKYIERDDVWINFLDRKGNLTVGYGSPNCIGPELEFGIAVGAHFKEQVLLIKTAWGGRSLARDFRPPGSALPQEEKVKARLLKINENIRKENEKQKDFNRHKPEVTLDAYKAGYGASYREMIAEVRKVLNELPERFPEYKNQGYEIAGFVWFHGWNDMIDNDYTAEYAKNLENLIRDVRRDFKIAKLPVVIGTMGQDGEDAKDNILLMRNAVTLMEKIERFKGNVKVVRTEAFWDKKAAVLVKDWDKHKEEWNKVGSDYGYHYLGSAITFCKVGRAFGEAMIELVK